MTAPIVTFPDEVLRLTATEVTDFPAAARLANTMIDTIRTRGIGLAAPQVGVSLRLAVVKGRVGTNPFPIVLVNPRIVLTSDEKASMAEGCLSLPGIRLDVERPARIEVEYWTQYGESRRLEAAGLLATCIQHEIDHLDGRLILDHVTDEVREEALARYAAATAT